MCESEYWLALLYDFYNYYLKSGLDGVSCKLVIVILTDEVGLYVVLANLRHYC